MKLEEYLPDPGVNTKVRGQVVMCRGCEFISFRKTFWHDFDPEALDVEVYPPRAAGRRELADSHLLPASVRSIYDETLTALGSGLHILAGIGIRALVEAVCKEKGAQGGSLEKRIDDLVLKYVLTPEGAEILHRTRFLGNIAAHEARAPEPKALSAAMDVAEHLLLTVYLLKIKAASLPQRHKP